MDGHRDYHKVLKKTEASYDITYMQKSLNWYNELIYKADSTGLEPFMVTRGGWRGRLGVGNDISTVIFKMNKSIRSCIWQEVYVTISQKRNGKELEKNVEVVVWFAESLIKELLWPHGL